MSRRLQRLVDLEARALARAGDAEAVAAERVRSLSDEELEKAIAYADARPDLEFLTPDDFSAALDWPREKVVAVLFPTERAHE
jgi:hypothetical protein